MSDSNENLPATEEISVVPELSSAELKIAEPVPFLVFTNPGEIDIRAVTTLGINAKTSSSAIGHFGTGLKYAIASILRLGGTVAIYSGREIYAFEVVKETIREKDFGFIKLHHASGFSNQQEPEEIKLEQQILGFTIDLGKNWQPWMFYRELWSNDKDEGGQGGILADNIGLFPHPLPEAGTTSIIVGNCPELIEAHNSRNSFLLSSTPLWQNEQLEIHLPREDKAIFYRGIKIASHNQKKQVYSYNILAPQTLTEDRTLDVWTASYHIVHVIAKLNNKDFAEAILLAPDNTFEHTFRFDYVGAFSAEVRAAVALLRYNTSLNGSARRRGRSLYIEDTLPVAIPMTKTETDQIEQFLELLEYFKLPHPWEAVRTCKLVHQDDDEIVLSNNILWIREDILKADDWLLKLMSQRLLGVEYNIFHEERQLLSVMWYSRPDHPALKPYNPVVLSAVKAVEEAIVATTVPDDEAEDNIEEHRTFAAMPEDETDNIPF